MAPSRLHYYGGVGKRGYLRGREGSVNRLQGWMQGTDAPESSLYVVVVICRAVTRLLLENLLYEDNEEAVDLLFFRVVRYIKVTSMAVQQATLGRRSQLDDPATKSRRASFSLYFLGTTNDPYADTNMFPLVYRFHHSGCKC